MLFKRVDLRRLGGSAGGNDVVGDGFDGRPRAAGEKEPGALSREGPRDSTSDRASSSVYNCNLVLEHHRRPLSVWPSYSSWRRIQSCQSSPSSRPLGAWSRGGR